MAAPSNSSLAPDKRHAPGVLPCDVLTGAEIYVDLDGKVKSVTDDYYSASERSESLLDVDSFRMRAAWAFDAAGNKMKVPEDIESEKTNAIHRINVSYRQNQQFTTHFRRAGVSNTPKSSRRSILEEYEEHAKAHRRNIGKYKAAVEKAFKDLPETTATLSEKSLFRIKEHASTPAERDDAEQLLLEVADHYPSLRAIFKVMADRHWPINIIHKTDVFHLGNFDINPTVGMVIDYSSLKQLRSPDPKVREETESVLIAQLYTNAYVALDSDNSRYFISDTTWPKHLKEMKQLFAAIHSGVTEEDVERLGFDPRKTENPTAPAWVMGRVASLAEQGEEIIRSMPNCMRTFNHLRKHIHEVAGMPLPPLGKVTADHNENSAVLSPEPTPAAPQTPTAPQGNGLPMTLLTGREAYIDEKKNVHFVVDDYLLRKTVDSRESARSRVAWVPTEVDPDVHKRFPCETPAQAVSRIYSFHAQQDKAVKLLMIEAYDEEEARKCDRFENRTTRQARMAIAEGAAKKRRGVRPAFERKITHILDALPEHAEIPEDIKSKIEHCALDQLEEATARETLAEIKNNYPIVNDVMHILGLRHCPINVMKNMMPKDPKEAGLLPIEMAGPTGPIIDLSVLKDLDKPEKHAALGAVVIVLTRSACRALNMDFDKLGLSRKEWRDIDKEMRDFFARNNMSASSYRSYPEMAIGEVAALAEVSHVDVAALRRQIPKSYRLYETFRSIMRDTLKDMAPTPPPAPPITDPAIAAGAGHAAGEKARAASFPPDRSVPYPAPGTGKQPPSIYDPVPFTDPRNTDLHTLEKNLIEGTKPFLDDALAYDPPHNQCSVRLLLNDNAQKGGFPIDIVFRNKDRVDRHYAIFTGTDNLDKAIELKKTIQSHILNHPRIVPLWMSHLQAQHNGGERLRPSEMIPSVEPVSEKIVNHYDYFGAEFTFDVPSAFGAATNHITIRIPLGLDYASDNKEAQREADVRMGLVKSRMELLRGQGRWETVGEATQMLKSVIRATERPLGWHMNRQMDVDMPPFDKLPLDLPFPHQEGDMFTQQGSGQKTSLKYAKLVLEKGEQFPNPTWRLVTRIEVDGVNADGTPVKLYPTINLHTSDETAAQLRAVETLESLAMTCHDVARRNPTAMWKADDQGNLIICDKNGYQPTAPDPTNFAEIHSDMVHFKTNFALHEIKEERREVEGRIHVTLGVKRGTEADGDLVDFNNSTRQPLRIRFSVDAKEGNSLPRFIEAAGKTFKDFIDDNYGNRSVVKGEVVRKKRVGFKSDTIGNLLIKVFEKAQKYGGLETVDQQFVSMGTHIEILDAPVSARKGVPKAPMWEDEDLKKPSIAPKSIRPGSGDLGRTGRTRSDPT